jgi:hypothetical protein
MAQEKTRKTEEKGRKKGQSRRRLQEEKTKTYRSEIYHVCRSNNFLQRHETLAGENWVWHIRLKKHMLR